MSEPLVKVSSDAGCGVFAAMFLFVFWATVQIKECRENPPTVRIEVKQVPSK